MIVTGNLHYRSTKAVYAYNNEWLRKHPDVRKGTQRRSQQRQRERRAALRPQDKISLSEAAKRLGVSRERVRQYVAKGWLAATRDPLDKRQRLVDVADVERLKAQRAL